METAQEGVFIFIYRFPIVTWLLLIAATEEPFCIFRVGTADSFTCWQLAHV